MSDFRESLVFTRIRERGPNITEEDVRAFEQEIDATLPTDYREFLLWCNGGCYYDEYIIEFPMPGGPVGDSIAGFSFSSLKITDGRYACDIRWHIQTHEGRIPSGTIPIGSAHEDLLLLNLHDGGKMYLWVRDLELQFDDPNENKFFLANSFAEFANGCRYISDEEMEMSSWATEEPFRSIELRRNERLKEFLDNGFPLYETNHSGQTMLYVACLSLNYEAAEELLRRGANPDDGDHTRGYPPLYAAAAPGAGELATLLLSYGASRYMDIDQTRPILDSLRAPPTEYIRRIFQER